MDTIRQACPQCKSTLELPASAVGRMARCPACQHTFRVPEPQTAPPSSEPGTAGPAPTAPLTQPNQPPISTFEIAGEKPAGAWSAASSSPSSNPYAVSGSSSLAEPVKRGSIHIQKAKINEILNVGWAIFSQRWQPLVLATLIYAGIAFGAGLLLGIVMGIVQVADPNAGIVVSLLLMPIVAVVSWYMWIGIYHVALRVARGVPASPTHVFVAPGRLVKLIPILIPFVLLGLVSQYLGSQMQQQGPPNFDAIFMNLGINFGIGAISALLMLFVWPMFLLSVDDQVEVDGFYSTGLQIAVTNLLNGFLLFWVLQFLLIFPVILTCGLGALVTTPLQVLFSAVGYLLMTGQRVWDPQQIAPPNPYPQYTPGANL